MLKPWKWDCSRRRLRGVHGVHIRKHKAQDPFVFKFILRRKRDQVRESRGKKGKDRKTRGRRIAGCTQHTNRHT